MAKAEVKIKFGSNLPFTLEQKLVHKYGFSVYSRLQGHWVVFSRKCVPGVVVTDELTEDQKKALLTQIDNIMAYYSNPYAATAMIRTRLHNIAQGKTAAERQFIEDFMEEELPIGGPIS